MRLGGTHRRVEPVPDGIKFTMKTTMENKMNNALKTLDDFVARGMLAGGRPLEDLKESLKRQVRDHIEKTATKPGA